MTMHLSITEQAKKLSDCLAAMWTDILGGHLEIDETARTRVLNMHTALKARYEQIEDVRFQRSLNLEDRDLWTEEHRILVQLGNLSRATEILCVAIREKTGKDYLAIDASEVMSEPRFDENNGFLAGFQGMQATSATILDRSRNLPHLVLRVSSKPPDFVTVQITDAGPLSFISDQRIDNETRKRILQAADQVAGVVNRHRQNREAGPKEDENSPNHAIETELRDLGRLMFRLFLTQNAKEVLRQPSIVIIEAADKWIEIPWELLFDEEDFLCLKHQVGRRVITNRPSMPPRHKRGEKLNLLLIGDPTSNLAGAREETRQITQLLADEPSLAMHGLVGLHECTKLDVIKVLSRGNWDIVHYAGHAHFSFLDPGESSWTLADGELKAFEIAELFGEDPPALVFSNACESGRETEHGKITYENEVYGLASGFMCAGVSAYIGALWPVYDQAAALIAAEFYKNIARGSTIGQALGTAKHEVIEELGMSEIAWASFMLYGSPELRLWIEH
ncbi:MAG: CHAT domain-containing protein [Chloroflexi bacterium]|nr:CHAT domain-containing protein [Chloroflexota bacterium]MBU1746971.1 CHAT domain-containing protein [Chloroflexota bacterium]